MKALQNFFARFKRSKPVPTVSELEAQASEELECTHPHYHKDQDGFLVQCYHTCRTGFQSTLGSVAFWIGITVSYPFEHFLYEHVWPFKILASLLGH